MPHCVLFDTLASACSNCMRVIVVYVLLLVCIFKNKNVESTSVDIRFGVAPLLLVVAGVGALFALVAFALFETEEEVDLSVGVVEAAAEEAAAAAAEEDGVVFLSLFFDVDAIEEEVETGVTAAAGVGGGLDLNSALGFAPTPLNIIRAF